MRKKIVFGMAIISLVAIIVLCQKAGVRLKETFRESEETNSGAVIGMKEKENEKSDKKERGEKQGEAHKKRTVVVDAGHGGPDGGKTGVNGKLEKELNLIIAEKVKKLLEEEGIAVIMTREEDGWLAETRIGDLKERVRIMKESKADLAVSIHQNSYHEESVFGAQVFYYTDSKEGEKLALCMQAALVAGLDPANHRKAKGNKTYYMLKKTDAVLVICECGFLSNAEEEALLNTKEYQKKVADALCDGVLTYLGEKKNGKEKTQTKTEETAAGAASAYACPAGGLSGIRRI